MVARRTEREAGLTATAVAVVMPGVILLLMLAVQYGLWHHAKQLADEAADQAVDAAQWPGATAADGDNAARAFLAQAGNLANVTVAVDRGADTVVVTIGGDAPRLVPLFAWTVTARAEGPVERFVPEVDR